MLLKLAIVLGWLYLSSPLALAVYADRRLVKGYSPEKDIALFAIVLITGPIALMAIVLIEGWLRLFELTLKLLSSIRK